MRRDIRSRSLAMLVGGVAVAAKEPDTLDPHSSTIGESQAISRFLYGGLTRFAIKDGKVTTAEVEPALAESWKISPDGTVWTFTLRRGVPFHKGFGEVTPCTSPTTTRSCSRS